MELYHTATCSTWLMECKCGIYIGLNDFSKKHPYLSRLTGFSIGFTSASITLAERVCSIGEVIIKGLSNIFGAPFSKDCKCLKGLKQIFIQLPFRILSLLIAPVELGICVISDTLGILISPENYSNWTKVLYLDQMKILKNLTDSQIDFNNDWQTKLYLTLYR